MQYLKGPYGKEAMEVIFSTQSQVVAHLALFNEAKHATRVSVQEATKGMYNGAYIRSRNSLSRNFHHS